MNASAPALASARYEGRLVAPAECRMKAVDAAGRVVPVLVMELELDTVLRTRMRVEQPFPAQRQWACEAAARRYKPGTRVAIEAPLVGLRLIATHTQHVRVLPTDPHQPEDPSR